MRICRVTTCPLILSCCVSYTFIYGTFHGICDLFTSERVRVLKSRNLVMYLFIYPFIRLLKYFLATVLLMCGIVFLILLWLPRTQ